MGFSTWDTVDGFSTGGWACGSLLFLVKTGVSGSGGVFFKETGQEIQRALVANPPVRAKTPHQG